MVFSCASGVGTKGSRLIVSQETLDAMPNLIEADGAYCWFSSPRAIWVKNSAGEARVLTGWVKSDGTVEAGLVDPETKECESFVLHEKMEIDDHDNPSFVELANGNWMAFYSKHSTHNGIFTRTTTIPGDMQSWGTEVAIKTHDPDFYEGATFYENAKANAHYTYANVFKVPQENNRLYLFWRGFHYKPNMSYSDDNGKTWSPARIVLLEDNPTYNSRPYVRYFGDKNGKIHLTFTDGHPRDEKFNSVYYAYLQNGAFYEADGTLIAKVSQLPMPLDTTEKVYDARAAVASTGEGRAWVWDVATDEKGNPVIAYTKSPTETHQEYWVARYTNEGWQELKIADAGKWFPQTPIGTVEPEPHYTGGISIDPENWQEIYYSTNVSGKSVLMKVRIKLDVISLDAGNTMAGLTAPEKVEESKWDQVRPVTIRGKRPTKMKGANVIWMENFYYRHWADYRSAINLK